MNGEFFYSPRMIYNESNMKKYDLLIKNKELMKDWDWNKNNEINLDPNSLTSLTLHQLDY